MARISGVQGAGSSSSGSDSNILTNQLTDPSVNVGDAVRKNGSGTIIQAIANNETNGNMLGFVTFKGSSTSATIQTAGIMTVLSGLTENAEYWLSDSVAGAIQLTPPTANGSVQVSAGQALSSTQFVIRRSPIGAL